MPRPTNINSELLAQWEEEIANTEKDPSPAVAHLYTNPAVKTKLHDIGLAGKWLAHELQEAKAEPDKIAKFSAAFGQRCFMAPDVWDLAIKSLEIYRKSHQTAVYVTLDLPEDERQQLLEIFTKVHPPRTSAE